MTQQNEITLIPVNQDGERVGLDPSIIKSMDNIELTEFFSQLKVLKDMYNKTEKEVKKRLDEGQKFNRLSYGKGAKKKVIQMTNQQKFDLVTKHGWDCVVPLTLKQLIELCGKDIEKEIEQSIVFTENKPSLKWDA